MDRSITLLLIYTVIRGFGVASFLFLFPLYLLSLNYHTSDIGGFNTLGSLPSLFIIPFIGYLVDRGWARELLYLSNIALSLAMILPVFLPYYPVFILSYFLLSLAMYSWMGSRLKLITYVVSQQVLGRIYGLFGIMFNSSRTITPFILGRITFLGYDNLLLYTSLILFTVSTILYISLLSIEKFHETRRRVRPGSLLESYRELYGFLEMGNMTIILFSLIDSFAWRLWFPLLNPYLKEYCGFSDELLGNYISLFGLAMLFTSYFAGMITDHVKPVKALIIYELLGAFGVALLSTTGLITIYLSAILFGFSIAFWVTAFNSLLTIIYESKKIGRIRSLTDTARMVSGVPAPQIGGVLLRIRPSTLFITSIGLMLTAAIIINKVKREK